MCEKSSDLEIFKNIRYKEINDFFELNQEELSLIYGVNNLENIKEYLVSIIDRYSYMLNLYLKANVLVLRFYSTVQEYTQIKDIIELTELGESYNIEFKMSDCRGCMKDCDYEGCIKLYPIR